MAIVKAKVANGDRPETQFLQTCEDNEIHKQYKQAFNDPDVMSVLSTSRRYQSNKPLCTKVHVVVTSILLITIFVTAGALIYYIDSKISKMDNFYHEKLQQSYKKTTDRDVEEFDAGGKLEDLKKFQNDFDAYKRQMLREFENISDWYSSSLQTQNSSIVELHENILKVSEAIANNKEDLNSRLSDERTYMRQILQNVTDFNLHKDKLNDIDKEAMLQKFEKHLQDVQNNATELKNEVLKLKKISENNAADIENYRISEDDLQRIKDEINSTLVAHQISNLKEELQKYIQQYEEKISQLEKDKTKMDTIIGQFAKTLLKMQNNVSTIEADVSNVNVTSAVNKESIEEMKKEILKTQREHKDDINLTASNFVPFKEDMRKLKEAVEENKNSKAVLNQVLSNITALTKNVTRLKEQLDKYSTKIYTETIIQENNAEFEKKLKIYEIDIQNLQRQGDKEMGLEMDINKANGDIETLRKEFQIFQNTTDDRITKIEGPSAN